MFIDTQQRDLDQCNHRKIISRMVKNDTDYFIYKDNADIAIISPNNSKLDAFRDILHSSATKATVWNFTIKTVGPNACVRQYWGESAIDSWLTLTWLNTRKGTRTIIWHIDTKLYLIEFWIWSLEHDNVQFDGVIFWRFVIKPIEY